MGGKGALIGTVAAATSNELSVWEIMRPVDPEAAYKESGQAVVGYVVLRNDDDEPIAVLRPEEALELARLISKVLLDEPG